MLDEGGGRGVGTLYGHTPLRVRYGLVLSLLGCSVSGWRGRLGGFTIRDTLVLDAWNIVVQLLEFCLLL